MPRSTAPDTDLGSPHYWRGIAEREGCSVRKVNMTILLAFLAPDLVKAAIAGRLPYGMGIARLTDLPAEWSRQRPDARLSIPLTQHSNRVSTNIGLCPRETRFCAVEITAPKGILKANRREMNFQPNDYQP